MVGAGTSPVGACHCGVAVGDTLVGAGVGIAVGWNVGAGADAVGTGVGAGVAMPSSPQASSIIVGVNRSSRAKGMERIEVLGVS